MSQSVLKRCLQIVEDDLPLCSSSKQTKKNFKKKPKPKNSTIFDLIPEHKRLTITTKVGKSQTKSKSEASQIPWIKLINTAHTKYIQN